MNTHIYSDEFVATMPESVRALLGVAVREREYLTDAELIASLEPKFDVGGLGTEVRLPSLPEGNFSNPDNHISNININNHIRVTENNLLDGRFTNSDMGSPAAHPDNGSPTGSPHPGQSNDDAVSDGSASPHSSSLIHPVSGEAGSIEAPVQPREPAKRGRPRIHPATSTTNKIDAWRDLTKYQHALPFTIDKVCVQVFCEKDTAQWSAKVDFNQNEETGVWDYQFSAKLMSNSKGTAALSALMDTYDVEDAQQKEYLKKCYDAIKNHIGEEDRINEWKAVSFLWPYHALGGKPPAHRPLNIVLFVNMMDNKKRASINIGNWDVVKDKVWMGEFVLFAGEEKFTGRVVHASHDKSKKAPLLVMKTKKKFQAVIYQGTYDIANAGDEWECGDMDFSE